MCLATPQKIKQINGPKAIVKSKNHEHSVDISLIKNARVGDYILVHADMAINKIPAEEAKKILQIINNNHEKHEK